MHEPLTNLRPVIFVQFARGTPRTEVWRGAARRRELPRRLRQDRASRSARTSIRPTPMRCSGRWPTAPTRSRTCTSCPIAAACRARNTGEQRRDSTMLIDATLKRPMPPLALPTREFMERRARIWEELGLSAAHAAGAVARLLARRLDRELGDLRAPRRGRRLGGDRPRDRCSASAAASRRKRRSGTSRRMRNENREFVPRRSARQPGLGQPCWTFPASSPACPEPDCWASTTSAAIAAR